MSQFYTYIYSDPSRDNQPFYVGKGSGRRAEWHLNRTDKHEFVHRLHKMQRNGISPLIEKIYTSNEQFASELEKGLIKHFGRKNLGKGPLLNLTDGGDGPGTGYKFTEEQLARRRINHPMKNPTVVAKVMASHRGAKRSPEARARMSAAMKGKKQSAATIANRVAKITGLKRKRKEPVV